MLIIYSNTEEKDTTVNDEMSFAVAERVSEFSYSATSVSFNCQLVDMRSRDPVLTSDWSIGAGEHPPVPRRGQPRGDVACVQRGLDLRLQHARLPLRHTGQLHYILMCLCIFTSLHQHFHPSICHQTCVMTFAPSGNGGEFLELVEGGLEYLGPRDLTQYFIRSAVVLV